MSTVATIIVFKAKPNQGSEVARRLAAAAVHIEQEPDTPLWLVIRSETDRDTVFVVDLFNGPGGRAAHMKGAAAEMVFETVPPLLASEPEIHSADLVAQKGFPRAS